MGASAASGYACGFVGGLLETGNLDAASAFLSADPYRQCPENWLNHNRYAYCANNPVMYTDPSGEFFLVDDLLFALIGGTVNVISQIISGNLTKDNWYQGFAYFGAGAVGGWMSEYASPVVGGMFMGAANATLNGAFSGNGVSFESVLVGAVLGGATAYIGGEIGGAISRVAGDWLSGIASPVLRNALPNMIGGGVSGFAVGAGFSLFGGASFKEAMSEGGKGAAFGAALGAISGTVKGIRYGRENGVNPWTGRLTSPKYNLTPETGDFAENVTLYRGTTGSEGKGGSLFMTDNLEYAQKYILNGGHIESITIPKITLDRMSYNGDMQILCGEKFGNYNNAIEYKFYPNIKNQILYHMK